MFSGLARGLGIGVVLVALSCFTSGVAAAASPQDDLGAANAIVQQALVAARQGDIPAARRAYADYENTWFDIEDGIRATSRTSYVAIEKAMTAVEAALEPPQPEPAQVVDALAILDREQHAYLSGASAGGPTTASDVAPSEPTIGTLLDQLGEAQAALARGDYAAASGRLSTFESTWLDAEGQVKTRSADDYRQTETDMALAQSLVGQRSPEAASVVSRMAARLQPYQQEQRYGIFDASAILLREGMEALLVIVALSAVLKRSAARAGQAWLWSGAVAGVVLSIALGLAIRAFFGAVVTPTNRELLEGVVGLFAAAMLIYVSYWLHSKATLGGWRKYINRQTAQALEGGRLAGIGLLAFLAVFREGAETALFYLGMASSISNADLFIGLAIGLVVLVGLGFVILGLGVRVPMRPFFGIASVLVFYLCFKFIGTGIHALQVAGIVPSASTTYLPSVDVLGLYPTWQTTIAQGALLAAAAGFVLRDQLRRIRLSSVLASAAVLMLLGVACSVATPTSAPNPPALPPAAALTSNRPEASLVAGPRRRLEDLATALQRQDVANARAALDAYDAEWNGIEVYVNVRSRALYGEIESHYQADITSALQQPRPDTARILPLVQAMVASYDEAIRLSDSGPPLSPLFDDLAAVRTARAPLRDVAPALQAGDTARAASRFEEFKARWPSARPLLAARSPDVVQDTADALDAADRAMRAPTIDPSVAGPLVDTLAARYNYGVNLLNAAARNADLGKSAATADDVRVAAALGTMQNQLRASLMSEPATRAEVAHQISGPGFDSVAPILQARNGADAALAKALDAYVAVADDPAAAQMQVTAANRAAIEAIGVAQQVVAGQFWTDALFQAAYQAAVSR